MTTTKTSSLVNWNLLNNTLSRAILDGDRLFDVLEDLGCSIPHRSRGRDIRIPCPVHEGDSPNVKIDLHGYGLPIRWTCFSRQCQKEFKPSLLGLVRGVLSTRKRGKASMREAADFLAKYADDLPSDVRPEPDRDQPKPVLLNLSRAEVRARLEIPSNYFLDRGFSAEILDRFDVGYSHRLGRAVVPLYDDDGLKCVGFLGRSQWPACELCKHHHEGQTCDYGQSKWQLMTGFPKDRYLFNYAAARSTDQPFVFLVEGTPDVIRLAEAGYVGVALLGSDATSSQIAKLHALGKEVWVAFDNDKAGEEARERLLRRRFDGGNSFPMESFRVPPSYKDVGDTPVGELVRAVEWYLEDRKDRLIF